MHKTLTSLLFFLQLICQQSPSLASFVLPQLGGGSVPQAAAPMKHILVSRIGTTLEVSVDDSVGIPLLRRLEEPAEFDPSASWSVLQEKDHNFQYGWLVNGAWEPPTGAGVFVELLDTSPGLETYHVEGLLVSNTYDPIFGTAGSSNIWQWNGTMTHNAYAVENPTLTSYEASYRVYFGNADTAEPLAGYQAAEVTVTFEAIPTLTADFNGDSFVNGSDLSTWQSNYGATTGVTNSMGDADLDGDVDGIDFLKWQVQYTGGPSAIGSVPEPTSASILLMALAISSCCRSCGRWSWGRHRC